jgi:hypothetical protein
MSFSDVPGRRPVVRLGKVSEAAAALLAGESDRGPFLTPRANDRVPSQNALPLSEGLTRVGSLTEARHPAKTEISPPQPLPKQPQFPRESFPPSQTPVSRSRHLAICAAVAAVLVTIGFGVLLIEHLRLPISWSQLADEETVGSVPEPQQRKLSSLPASFIIPRLIIEGSSGFSGEPLRLRATLDGSMHEAVLRLTGLPHRMTLSQGQAISDNAWEVPVRDLGDTWVGPPPNFIGFVDLGAELHLSDVIVVYRRPIRLQWAPATP